MYSNRTKRTNNDTDKLSEPIIGLMRTIKEDYHQHILYVCVMILFYDISAAR